MLLQEKNEMTKITESVGLGEQEGHLVPTPDKEYLSNNRKEAENLLNQHKDDVSVPLILAPFEKHKIHERHPDILKLGDQARTRRRPDHLGRSLNDLVCIATSVHSTCGDFC